MELPSSASSALHPYPLQHQIWPVHLAVGANSQCLGCVSCPHGPMPVPIVCTYWASGSSSTGRPVGLSLRCLEMEVSSPRTLWPGCSEHFFSGWLPFLLAFLDRRALCLLMGETLQSGHTGGIPLCSLALLPPLIPALSLYEGCGENMG